MTIGFKASLQIHEQALAVRDARNSLLAENLANADTPGFKARDIDFREALAKAGVDAPLAMRVADPRHITGGAGSVTGEPGYRQALQPSLDGNTVDPDVEKAAFLDNSVRFQATLTFLNARLQGLRTAIVGEPGR